MSLNPRSIASFLRWRVVPVRMAGRAKQLRPRHITRALTTRRGKPVSEVGKAIERSGYCVGKPMPADVLEQITALIEPRFASAPASTNSHTFVNLMQDEDYTVDSPIIRYAFSKDVLDPALDYFGNRTRLYAIQLLWSFPHNGPLRESQKWHRDFSDSRCLHNITYLNDIRSEAGGPLMFVDKDDSAKVKGSPFIRRIEDDTFYSEVGHSEPITVLGDAGTTVLMDPAACYHCGSRCKSPRLALFVSFNSDLPYVSETAPISRHADALMAAGRELRPDLPDDIWPMLVGQA